MLEDIYKFTNLRSEKLIKLVMVVPFNIEKAEENVSSTAFYIVITFEILYLLLFLSSSKSAETDKAAAKKQHCGRFRHNAKSR